MKNLPLRSTKFSSPIEITETNMFYKFKDEFHKHFFTARKRTGDALGTWGVDLLAIIAGVDP